MLRYRRYRVFVVFAVISLFALYHFSRTRDLGSVVPGLKPAPAAPAAPKPADEKKPAAFEAKEAKSQSAASSVKAKPPLPPVKETVSHHADVPFAEFTASSKLPLPSIAPGEKPKHHHEEPAAPATTAPAKLPASEQDNEPLTPEQKAAALPPAEEVLPGFGEGRKEVTDLPSSVEPIYWVSQTEHFPVKSTIQLPKGTPKAIPRIQHTFGKESEEDKKGRLQKLAAIKEAFTHSWEGYREFAWLHDELSPASGSFRDPFCGWAATLVDGLDTLWIMGLKEEFDEAAKAVSKIDFKTSPRGDIPLFETTIRYLGGLLAAYDISGQQDKYRNLLDKAVELADVLMGAFDTPNRMPVTFYYWKPTFASQPHRAATHVVLAEIGSLSVEFTRLAQLTKEARYYDAIDRITDAFQEFQNSTRLPGMWPVYVDASGCKRGEYAWERPAIQSTQADTIIKLNPLTFKPESEKEEADGKKSEVEAAKKEDDVEYIPLDKPEPLVFSTDEKKTKDDSAVVAQHTKPKKPEAGKLKPWKSEHAQEEAEKLGAYKAKRREPEDFVNEKPATVPNAQPIHKNHPPVRVYQNTAVNLNASVCEPVGIQSSVKSGSDEFTLGGMSDSMYEYLPKEWLLLGGLEDKYRTMYEYSMEAIKEKLLYRPMTPDSRDLLMTGQLRTFGPQTDEDSPSSDVLNPEGAHLTCFAGGMFAMGAKIFKKPKELEMAAKLTDFCVWAYEVTTTGIMPEDFKVARCPTLEPCKWDQTAYYRLLDPFWETRPNASSRTTSSSKPFTAEATAAPTLTPVVKNKGQSEADAAKEKLAEAAKDAPTSFTDDEEAEGPAAKVKRQLDDEVYDVQGNAALKGAPTQVVPSGDEEDEDSDWHFPPTQSLPIQSVIPEYDPTLEELPAYTWVPPPPPTHEEYVEARITDERLPKGFVSIGSRKYILRPEAIESVFYMYRITGDKKWRDKGWKMFEAVQAATRTTYGNSAIDDVTKTAPQHLNEMESFWLAETLKYFYLLFADEGVVSLDDYVLNTEAHPFRRPDAKL